MKEIVTYFKFDGGVVAGWNIQKHDPCYDVYSYTPESETNDWELFFKDQSYDGLKTYLTENLQMLIDQKEKCIYDYQKLWLEKEIDWMNDTLEQLDA